MSSNRSITDFFKRSAAQGPSGGHAKDTKGPSESTSKRPADAGFTTSEHKSKQNISGNQDSFTSSISSWNPLSSGTSSLPLHNGAGQRVVRNGVLLIRSSDSEGENSDSSLEDVDAIMARFQRKPEGNTHAGTSETGPHEERRQLRTRHPRASKAGPTKRSSSPQRPKPQYKFSLNSLIALSDKDSISEAKIASVKARLEAGATDGATDLSTHGHDPEFDRNLLASVVEGDAGGEGEGRAQRLFQAMERTDALQQDTVWHFFQQDAEELQSTPFPASCLPSSGWSKLLKDPEKREQAFTSGYAANIVKLHCLPDEVMSWLIDELCSEPRGELCFAYIQTLTSNEERLKQVLTPDRMGAAFRRLGAKPQAVALDDRIVPVSQPTATPKRPLRDGFRWVVELLGEAATSLSIPAREHAAVTVLRLSMDDSVLNDISLLQSVQDCLTNLVDSFPDSIAESSLLKIATRIYSTLSSPILLNNLLLALPQHSPRLHNLARRLALSFFLASPHPLHTSLTSSTATLTQQVLTHLSTAPHFLITPQTDYIALAALISILDTAIGAGFRPAVFPSVPAETEFNDGVDALARRIGLLASRIVDAGAGHMRRTEAKGVMERLRWRLEYAVRTKRRPRRDVFAGAGEDAGRELMAKFVGNGGAISMS